MSCWTPGPASPVPACSPSTRTTSATGTHGSAPCTCAGPATWAAPAPGAYPLLDSAVRFVSARLLADGHQLAPAYTVDGGRVPDQRRLDLPGYAALLVPPLRGALPADDPRTVATLRAYAAALTEDGYVYRFRHDERPLAEAEGAFLLCGFIMALAQHQQGNEVEAARWFERNRAACGPADLYAEEYDVPQRQLRGNLPQAFVHALMLECSARLAGPPGAG